jgi:hypothetical protein
MSDRKYRQAGYQDVGGGQRERSGERPAGGPRERPEGPRGRGLGKPTTSVFRCSTCGTKNEGFVGSLSTCVKCRGDLHTCSHCAHFDTAVFNECRQQVPVRIAKKTLRNECGLFQAKVAQEQGGETGGTRDARSAFDALFKI